MHGIIHVARYEGKLQRREWLFRVLFILSVVGVPVFQFLTQSREVVPRWNMVTLPGAMPFVNAYLFNIVQSLLLAFSGVGVLERDRSKGSTECFWIRSFDNVTYCIGKYLGLLGVFVGVNALSIGVSCLLNLFYSDAPFNLWHYLFYLLTLTFPTAVFFAGVGFWLSGMFRARFLVSLVLLGLLWLSFSPFSGCFHGLLDVLGNQQANLISDVTGHVNGRFYLLHRLFYFFTGIGFFCASMYRFERLQNHSLTRYTLGGYFFVLLGFSCAFFSESVYAEHARARSSYRAAFKRNWNAHNCRVRAHDLTVEQRGDRLRGESEMVLYNPDSSNLQQLVLYLNPALEVKAVRQGNRAVSWKRDGQVLSVALPLGGQDSLSLSVSYEGTIDERYCDLTRSEDQLFNTSRMDEVFHFGRRHAFLSDHYVLLPPSCGWYPVAIPPENVYYPTAVFRDFTRFRLRVVKPRQKVVLSQGVSTRVKGSDTLHFVPSKPLDGLTLCGGDYRTREIRHRGINLRVYYFKGHELLSRFWPLADWKEVGKGPINDLLPRLNRKDELALTKLACKDWFEPATCRLMMVETPLAYDPFWKEGKLSSDRVQPGIIFFPERLAGFPISLRTEAQKKRAARIHGSERKAEEIHAGSNLHITKIAKAVETISPFFRVVKKSSDPFGRETAGTSVNNTCHSYPLYTSEVDVTSVRYPYFDIVLKMLYRSYEEIAYGQKILMINNRRLGTSSFDTYTLSNVPDDGVRRQAHAQLLLRGKRLEEVLMDSTLSEEELENVLFVKAKELMGSLNCSGKQFLNFLQDFYDRHRREVPLEVFSKELEASLGRDLLEILPAWSENRHDHYFLLKDMYCERFTGDHGFLFRGKIYNTSPTDGIVELKLIKDKEKRRFFLPGRTAREICWIGKCYGVARDVELDVGNSLHVPSIFTVKMKNRPGKLDKDSRFESYPIDTSGFRVLTSNEYIVDNEDAGFRVLESGLTLLRRLWDDPSIMGGRWKKAMNSRAHGETLRSFHAKQGGDGRSRVEWSVELPEPGRYEVKALVYHNQAYLRNDLHKQFSMLNVPWQKDSVRFHYTVSCGPRDIPVVIETINSQDNMAKAIVDAEQGILPEVRDFFYIDWVSLGVYDFPKGKTRVTLSDKGAMNDMIIADAMKWVKVE